ncbi:MAG: hypothetical protein EOO18_04155 [Chryseobacterium sp.]|nr:MAG: hypothetical protein EOO18_04155 [Chryseobacterium sp.]
MLNRLRFAEEVRDASEVTTATAKAKPAEVKMAISLIDQLTKPFDPSVFKDDYSDKLLTIIKAKAKNKPMPYKPMKIVHSKLRFDF